MKAATIHYFTGTGNTAAVANLLAQGLYMAGWQAQEESVPPVVRSPLQEGMHIFAFPVHALAVPQVMRRYMQSLEPAQRLPAAVVAVVGEVSAMRHGGYEGQALVEARRLLAARGFDVVLTDVVGHVANFTQAIQPPSPEQHAGIVEVARRQSESIVRRLAEGRQSFRPCGRLNQAWSIAVGWLYRSIGRRMLAKLFVADARCDGCGRCGAHCPVQAIRMVHARPRWSLACQACQRCINMCPQRAIQTSMLRLALSVAAAFLPYAAWFRRPLPAEWLGKIAPAMPALNVLLWLAGYVFALLVLDRALVAMEAVPGLRSIISFGHTRDFRRYIEPRFREKL